MLNPSQRQALLQQLGISDNEGFVDSVEELGSVILEFTIMEQLESDALRSNFLDLIESDETGQLALDFAREHVPNLDDLVTQRIREQLAKTSTKQL
ncbi:MAG: hypothetical protein E6P95_00015 [Candidatus Moraniibacteriota bacterium]|nr:MAG: hypothetical protein E6P95_00015 [Candidatus Moranbacteria bacterium]